MRMLANLLMRSLTIVASFAVVLVFAGSALADHPPGAPDGATDVPAATDGATDVPAATDGTAGTMARGSTYVSSGPGVYDATPAEYANFWGWYITSGTCAGNGNDHYYWYLFRTNGEIHIPGQDWYCGSNAIQPAANIYYWKEYNHTADHTGGGHVLTFWVCWNVGSSC